MESNDGFFPWLKNVNSQVSSTPPANGKNLSRFFAEAFFFLKSGGGFQSFQSCLKMSCFYSSYTPMVAKNL